MKKEFEKFNIGQVAIIIKDNKCLILEFTKKQGWWGLPGGRIDQGESGEEAFKRELKEETDISNFELISVVDYDIWITGSGQPFCGIANLINITSQENEIKLSPEHNRYKWVGQDELVEYKFIWPKAKRMIKKGFKYSSLINKYEK